MTEYYRQFAFVTSVLGGFSFALFGTLLLAPSSHRAASWAALLSVTASVAFLLDTIGMTFGGIYSGSLPPGGTIPPRIASQLGPLSQLFCAGVLLLLASFGLGGWVRSRTLGIATTTVAVLGAIAAYVVMTPYMHY
jgi:hypothetical protein